MNKILFTINKSNILFNILTYHIINLNINNNKIGNEKLKKPIIFTKLGLVKNPALKHYKSGKLRSRQAKAKLITFTDKIKYSFIVKSKKFQICFRKF